MSYLYTVILFVLFTLPTYAQTQATLVSSGKDNDVYQYISVAKNHLDKGNYQNALDVLKMIESGQYNTLEDFTQGSLFGAFFNVGTHSMQNGDYALAVVAYEQAKALKSDDFRLHYSLGICYRKIGNYKASIKTLTKATLLNPKFASSHFNLGSVYWKLKNYDQSLKAFQAAFKANPNHVSAQYMIGLTSWSLGNYRDAAEAWNHVLKMNPNHKKAKKWLSRLRMRVQSAG